MKDIEPTNQTPRRCRHVRLPKAGVERASAVVMTRIRALLAITTISAVLMVGCGPSASTPSPAPPTVAAKPDVTITLDGAHHACVVALSREAQGSIISCNDVVPFIRDELRLPSGSTYDLRTISEVDAAEVASVGARLKDAGYRVAGT